MQWLWLKDVMPEDSYKICSGRLFISVTRLTMYGFQNEMISEYSSNQDLFECLLASSTIPYVTERSGMRVLRGRYVLDGGITNNTPVFMDGCRRQLVFRLTDVEYPFRLLVNARDSCIDALVVRGGMLMARFLEGERVETIAWLARKETKADLTSRYVKPNQIIRMMLAPICVCFIMAYRGMGFADVSRFISDLLNKKSATDVIPFKDAAEVFGAIPLKYMAGAVLATITDVLRSFNILL
jgi:hypothetical protein